MMLPSWYLFDQVTFEGRKSWMDRDWSDIMSLVISILLGWFLGWSRFVDIECCLSLDF